MLSFDRRSFIASLGGAAAVSLLTHEARADALEDALMMQSGASSMALAAAASAPAVTEPRGFADAKPPTVAELAAAVPQSPQRKGTGGIFFNAQAGAKLPLLAKMPAKPTLVDFFELRFQRTRNHCFQSAGMAMRSGADEEVILACLLHDTSQELMRSDHGYWGGQLYAPYLSERANFAIKYHQALRFFDDEKVQYKMPDFYRNIFGVDYVPAPHVQRDYAMVRKHRWYDAPRAVTVNDLYAFDANAKVSIDPFLDILGRHFKQPKEGLGNDNSAVAHMWRTLANPDAPL